MIDPSSPQQSLARRCHRTLGSLARNQDGISMVEFGLTLPILVALGMFGVEVAHMTSVNMQVSQLALGVADNASRLGQTDNSAISPTVGETDIDAVMFGAVRQGQQLDFEENGRVLLSSLERDTATGKQYIHWQRCAGDLERESAYGNDTNRNGLAGPTLVGMGKAGHRVTASAGQAVMYVEVFYTYQPLFGSMFMEEKTFAHESAYLVRDDRNLSGGGGDGLSGTTTSTCA